MPETSEMISLHQTAALDYMQSMLGQLRKMASSERCDMLAYLIEMAYIEATDILRGDRPARHATALGENKRHSAA